MLIAQNSAPSGTSAGAGSSDQNNAASSGANTGGATAGTTSGSDQTGANAAGTTGNDQTGAAAGTSDNTSATAGSKRQGKNGNLPQTASPLPLLGLLGLGTTGLGILASKKRRS